MDWLMAPMDPTRVHDVGLALSWHARFMVLAWGILAPLCVLIARYFKVLPGQNWPHVLDTQVWWRVHWIGQSAVLALTVLGVALIWFDDRSLALHSQLGYAVLILVIGQVLLGLLRGSKGGPTDPAPDGSLRGAHYDMTPQRVFFEWSHKLLGYAVLAVSVITILLGLWDANAPRWMGLVLALWWFLLISAAFVLQKRGRAIDTYQAIWGPDLRHPGNRRKPIGFGITRQDTHQPGE